MFKSLICLIVIIKLTQAQHGYMPTFYEQDDNNNVDRNKPPPIGNNLAINYRNKIQLPPIFPFWLNYPSYRIIRPLPLPQFLSINNWIRAQNVKPSKISTITPTTTSSTSTSTTTTTTPQPTTSITSSPFLTDDEFPIELLYIAQNKLGLKSLDEIPSILELGQLLGTNSPQETLKYIKKLTMNKQGVALMKAYIESADYTDSSGDLEKRYEEDKDLMGGIEEAVNANDLDSVVVSDENSNNDYELNNESKEAEESTTLMPSKMLQNLEKPKAHQSFMQHITNFMQLNDLIDTNPFEQQREINENITEVDIKAINNNKSTTKNVLENQTASKVAEEQETNEYQNLKTPILVRESIPYNYPVPIRISHLNTTTSLPPLMNSLNSNTTSAIHLNTPKILIPHVQQISKVTKIPTNKIEDFLASKPKLVELATKISQFPINYDRDSPVEAQVMSAVQKAIEQDEDLKKLLSSASTLK